MHCNHIQTGEIQAIVGDASRNGAGGQQYCGLWSLTSKHRQFNAFGNSFAGLLPGEIRGKGPTLELVDETSCALVRKADDARPVDVRAEYNLGSPHYVDHTLWFTDRDDVRSGRDFREVSWCCYMNCPEDSRLNFISGGEWLRYISPSHGTGSNIAPSYVADDALEVWPAVEGRRPFHWDRCDFRFDQPFYYGRLGKMAMILIFDDPRWLRFYCSPSGGGRSLLPGQTCPAWDFEWVIPNDEYEVGKEYRLRVRLVYKLFESDEDVLAEVSKAQNDLGFERAT
jgi:hypothetical protein